MAPLEIVILTLIVFASTGWFIYTSWRDNKRWNGGVCKETGKFWEFTGGVSFLGFFCYRGGRVKGETQFIWLSELRTPDRKRGFGPGTNC